MTWDTLRYDDWYIPWANKGLDKLEQFHGPDINKFREINKYWSPKEKYELVYRDLSGQGLRSVAITASINSGQLHQWVHKYKTLGYNGLINKPKGGPTKDYKMKVQRRSYLKKWMRVYT